MDNVDLCYLSIADASALFDAAKLSPVELTRALFDRIEATDGAVMLAKANTHEMAGGGTTNTFFYGATHNPWGLERVPAGSSGGSGAALAAGQCLGALGTDTAGSIRMPAAFCGITGHKPTFGLVSRAGVHPLSQTLDHPGPMTRSAYDAALMLDTLAGFDASDPDMVERPATSYTAGIGDGIAG